MPNAQATRGTTGQKLMAGFDIHGGGIQVDQACTYSALQEAIAPPKEWKQVMLVNLINSSNPKINQLALHLENEGYDLFDKCEYNNAGNIYFIAINGAEFRIKQNKILKL